MIDPALTEAVHRHTKLVLRTYLHDPAHGRRLLDDTVPALEVAKLPDADLRVVVEMAVTGIAGSVAALFAWPHTTGHPAGTKPPLLELSGVGADVARYTLAVQVMNLVSAGAAATEAGDDLALARANRALADTLDPYDVLELIGVADAIARLADPAARYVAAHYPDNGPEAYAIAVEALTT